jgi:hypothetical protein
LPPVVTIVKDSREGTGHNEGYMNNRVTTFAKRQREQDQKERARERDARRAERRARSKDEPNKSGEDPDIAGIVHGPQPVDIE